MVAMYLSGSTGSSPSTYPALLESLSSQPRPAVISYDEDGSRVELSGRVLANWAVKLIGLFAEEYELTEEDRVLMAVSPHWKTAAAALAVAASGAELVFEPGSEADVVITDDPNAWIGRSEIGQAQLAAITHGVLDSSFEGATGEAIPAWVLDISADVRQQPDQLLNPLPPVQLPDASSPAGSPVLTRWGRDSLSHMLSLWARAEAVIIVRGEPGDPQWEQMRQNEGVE